MTACHTTPPGAGDCCIGIEIGGTKLQLVVGTSAERIVERRRFAVDRDGGAAGIRAQLANALPELMQSGLSASATAGRSITAPARS